VLEFLLHHHSRLWPSRQLHRSNGGRSDHGSCHVHCLLMPFQASPSTPQHSLDRSKKVTLPDAAPLPHLTQFDVHFSYYSGVVYSSVHQTNWQRVSSFFLLVLYIADNHTLGQQMVVIPRHCEVCLQAKCCSITTGIETCLTREMRYLENCDVGRVIAYCGCRS
jgi:hypothetical protein